MPRPILYENKVTVAEISAGYLTIRDTVLGDSVTLAPDEADALAVAWLRWRADHAPADIERLLAAAEGEQANG